MLISKIYFLDIIQNKQDKLNGNWDDYSFGNNIISKTVYTCQVLGTLGDYFQRETKSISLAEDAIKFLSNTETNNRLYDLFLKCHVYSKWPDLIPFNNFKNKLAEQLISSFGEYGGHLNSNSFELCFLLETVININLYSQLPSSIKSKYESSLEYYLNQPTETIKDFSHFLWATNISYSIFKRIPKNRIEKIKKILKYKIISNGYWVLDGIKDQPSKTPVLRSDEYYSSYLVINLSKLMSDSQYDEIIYHNVFNVVSVMLNRFDITHQWVSNSKLVGMVKGDIYQTCAFLKALYAFSKIDKSSHDLVCDKLNMILINYDTNFIQNNQNNAIQRHVHSKIFDYNEINKSYFETKYQIIFHAGIEGQEGRLLIDNEKIIKLSKVHNAICLKLFNELKETWDSAHPRDIGWVPFSDFRKSVPQWNNNIKKAEKTSPSDVVVSDAMIRNSINRINKDIREKLSLDKDLIENGTPFLWAKHYRFRINIGHIDISD